MKGTLTDAAAPKLEKPSESKATSKTTARGWRNEGKAAIGVRAFFATQAARPLFIAAIPKVKPPTTSSMAPHSMPFSNSLHFLNAPIPGRDNPPRMRRDTKELTRSW